MKAAAVSSNQGERLVRQYKLTGNQTDKEAAVREYLPLVKHIVGRLNLPENGLMKREDLYQFGILGLLDALERYQPDFGASFKTFAYRRIYGEIIDAVRRVGILNREQTREVQLIAKTFDDLRHRLQREPTIEEVCQTAGLTLDKYFEIEQTNHLNFTISLDERVDGDDESSLTRKELISDEESLSPEQQLDKENLKNALKVIIEKLPERERLLLALYYYEELTLADIGQVLGLSESRVSQLLKACLVTIRKELFILENRR